MSDAQRCEPWTREEDDTLLRVIEEERHWKPAAVHLPHRTLRAIETRAHKITKGGTARPPRRGSEEGTTSWREYCIRDKAACDAHLRDLWLVYKPRPTPEASTERPRFVSVSHAFGSIVGSSSQTCVDR